MDFASRMSRRGLTAYRVVVQRIDPLQDVRTDPSIIARDVNGNVFKLVMTDQGVVEVPAPDVDVAGNELILSVSYTDTARGEAELMEMILPAFNRFAARVGRHEDTVKWWLPSVRPAQEHAAEPNSGRYLLTNYLHSRMIPDQDQVSRGLKTGMSPDMATGGLTIQGAESRKVEGPVDRHHHRDRAGRRDRLSDHHQPDCAGGRGRAGDG